MNNIKRTYALIFAFAAVYIIWGSTYLAIRYAIETIPPWTVTGIRYVISAALSYAIALMLREGKLMPSEVRIASISGLFMITANGVVCVAEQWVPSGIAAVIIGAMPIWIMMIGWGFFRTIKPDLQKLAGAVVGVLGVAIIAGGDLGFSKESSMTLGILCLMLSSCLWATGTLVQRGRLTRGGLFRFAAVQSLVGAVPALIFSLVFEKSWALPIENISMASLLALAYLIIFGSIVAFTAYSWLAKTVEPHVLSTYALVNPLIALFLGWLFFSEQITTRVLFATFLVLVGLALLLFKRKKLH